MNARIPPLHHVVDGPQDAPVAVLIHSIATSSAIWSLQVPAWAEKFRLIRVDLPGHGATPAADGVPSMADYAAGVIDILDRLAIERTVVVGLSLGGMVAQALVLDYPKRISALVLAQTSAQTPPPLHSIWQQRIEDFQRQGWKVQLAATLERWFTPTFLATAPLTVDWVSRQILATSAKGYCDAIGAIQQLAYFDRLSEINVPTLVVAGAADKAVTPEAALIMAKHLHDAEFVVLNAAAHLANIEQPIRFTEAVGGFLARTLSS